MQDLLLDGEEYFVGILRGTNANVGTCWLLHWKMVARLKIKERSFCGEEVVALGCHFDQCSFEVTSSHQD